MTQYLRTILIGLLILGFGSGSSQALNISGFVTGIGDINEPVSGASIEAWNIGGWKDSSAISGLDGTFTLNNIGSGPGYQIFVSKSALYIDYCSHFISTNFDISGLMIDLIPTSLWNEELDDFNIGDGFVLGSVVNKNIDDLFVEGVTIQVFDKNDRSFSAGNYSLIYFDNDLHPDAGLSSTSTNGMFLLIIKESAINESYTDPLAQYPYETFRDIKIVAVKDGWTFSPLSMSNLTRVFKFEASPNAGIVTVAAVPGVEDPVILPDNPEGEDATAADEGGGGGGSPCFINSAVYN